MHPAPTRSSRTAHPRQTSCRRLRRRRMIVQPLVTRKSDTRCSGRLNGAGNVDFHDTFWHPAWRPERSAMWTRPNGGADRGHVPAPLQGQMPIDLERVAEVLPLRDLDASFAIHGRYDRGVVVRHQRNVCLVEEREPAPDRWVRRGRPGEPRADCPRTTEAPGPVGFARLAVALTIQVRGDDPDWYVAVHGTLVP